MIFSARLLRIFAFFLFLSACSRNNETGLNPGDIPPLFELKDLDGHPVRLDNFKGKVVLINFWATWCAPCVQELPELQALYEKLQDRGFVILAVGGQDSVEAFKLFKDRFHLTFPIVYDVKGIVNKSYKVQGYPESFLLGRDQKLVMVSDPQSGQLVVRIVGPRNWSSSALSAVINQLLESAEHSKN